MNIKFNLTDNTLYVSLIGELDDCTSSFTRDAIDEKLRNYNYQNVVFDMSNLTFMDSTGIGVLIGRYKYLRNKNVSTYISNPTSTVEKIFKMSGIYEIMPKIS